MKRKTALFLSLFCLLLLFIALAWFARLRHSRSAENSAQTVSPANDSPLEASQGPDYFSDVKPVLAERCCSCHGAERQRGRLRLDAARFLKKGGRNGPAIIPGDSRNSLLIGVLTGVEGLPRMPPSGDPLDEQQIQQIIAWIDQGAPIPDHEELSKSDGHWAFRPPLLPATPHVEQQS